jgi:thiosulfate dehydrogenase
VTHFERAISFDPAVPAAEDLYSYLVSIASTPPTKPVPFTIVRVAMDLPAGSAGRGEALWRRTCSGCHGDAHTGNGKISPLASTVPEDTISLHGGSGPVVTREVIIEKIRTGSYLGFAGVMPPFSAEVLSDTDVSDLLTYLGLFN